MKFESLESSVAEGERYRLLIDSIVDYAIYMLDPTGRITSWNPGAERFKGYRPTEIIGQNFSRFYTDEDRAAGIPDRALAEAREQGRFEAEGWRVRKDGTRFWANVVIDAIRAPDGALIGFAKVTRDLSERREAEQALRSSEQQLRLLIQGVTDYAIYLLDKGGLVTSWNTGAERIKGYRADEVVGQHFGRFYTDEDRAAGGPIRALATAAADGRFEAEGWRVRKDGSQFCAHVIIDAIRGETGELIGFAKITRDVTERREAQQSLAHAQEALMQAQKLEALGQLTGGVAHDFNNLLMAVLGSLDLLRKHLPPDNAKARSLLENAVQGAERGASLTKRMLSFARKQELRLQPVNLPDLLSGMSALLEQSVGPSVELALDFEPDLPLVLTDAHQLDTALLNLVVNARDAMPDGGRILITAQPRAGEPAQSWGLPAGDYLMLSVTDQGHGMDEQTVARASEPFFTTKGVGKGTGLGLSMVHGLVQQSGGHMRINSRLGEGTQIELWLPVSTCDAAAATEERGAQPPATQRSLVVLAVDDDGLVLANTAAMLEDLGHKPLSAASAEDALAMLKAQAVDIVLTDFAMPHMNGLDLAKALKGSHPTLPVLLTSGYAELPPDEAHLLPRLHKPYSQTELAQALHRAATPAS